MKVQEVFSRAKHTAHPSEDAYVVTPHYAAVIDGATAKTPFRFADGESPGHRAATLLAEGIASLPAGLSAAEAISRLSRLLTFPNLPSASRPTASLVIYAAHAREIWEVGDCQWAYSLPDGTFVTHSSRKRIDTILATWRSDILKSLLARGIATTEEIATHDPARRLIQPFITAQVRYQNLPSPHPLAFGCLDGFPLPLKFLRITPLPAPPFSLLLASDGYPFLAPTLQEAESILSLLLQHDPLCYTHHLATKGVAQGAESFDDRTFLHLICE